MLHRGAALGRECHHSRPLKPWCRWQHKLCFAREIHRYNGNRDASAEEGSALRGQSGGCAERGRMMKQTGKKKGGKNVERLLRDSPLGRWVFQGLRALREQGRKSCSGSATGRGGERRKEGK